MNKLLRALCMLYLFYIHFFDYLNTKAVKFNLGTDQKGREKKVLQKKIQNLC